jgi:hypothetical protein
VLDDRIVCPDCAYQAEYGRPQQYGAQHPLLVDGVHRNGRRRKPLPGQLDLDGSEAK